eukprot:6777746-Pyramimonas_sp.AAC.1
MTDFPSVDHGKGPLLPRGGRSRADTPRQYRTLASIYTWVSLFARRPPHPGVIPLGRGDRCIRFFTSSPA